MSKEDSIPAEGTVVDKLPNALFKVRLHSSEHEVLAQVSGKIRKNSIRILLGDRVSIEMLPYDLSRGKITYRHRGNWNAVIALANQSIAVQTTKGETHYGLLQSADDAEIVVQIAGPEDFTTQEMSLRRDQARKVWRAKLRFDEKNIAKGAWIGAGVGFGATVVTLSAVAGKENADRALGAVWLPVLGAGLGAIVGVFWKKKHKKQDLVYSI
jgi:translation initiation factor IF-1